jgi:hypothetical protein
MLLVRWNRGCEVLAIFSTAYIRQRLDSTGCKIALMFTTCGSTYRNGVGLLKFPGDTSETKPSRALSRSGCFCLSGKQCSTRRHCERRQLAGNWKSNTCPVVFVRHRQYSQLYKTSRCLQSVTLQCSRLRYAILDRQPRYLRHIVFGDHSDYVVRDDQHLPNFDSIQRRRNRSF